MARLHAHAQISLYCFETYYSDSSKQPSTVLFSSKSTQYNSKHHEDYHEKTVFCAKTEENIGIASTKNENYG